ncbi:MAG: S8 family serine peptidase, partial [Chloroflexota bacterium]|nr:S8 family serine peptidase [Chloroflexota bacterium]
MVGVAPDVRLSGIEVLRGSGSGFASWSIARIDRATARAGTIEAAGINLGCECPSQAQDGAITTSTNAGVVYVADAGNSAVDAATFSPASRLQAVAVSAVADLGGKEGDPGAPTCRGDVDEMPVDSATTVRSSTWRRGLRIYATTTETATRSTGEPRCPARSAPSLSPAPWDRAERTDGEHWAGWD